MTNTTELRKRFESTKFAKEGGSCFECCDYEAMLEEQWAFLISEIEQAERAKVEEVIEELKHQTSIIFPDTLGAKSTAHVLVYRLSRKFLTQPNDPNY